VVDILWGDEISSYNIYGFWYLSTNSTRVLLIPFITAGVLVGLDVGCGGGADVKTRASVICVKVPPVNICAVSVV
jgi:hypothetical protein